jgi:hypothetical protein
MRSTTAIILVPNEVDPLNILLVVKFIKLLKKKGIILQSEINDPKTPFVFRFHGHLPSCKVICFFLKSHPLHKQSFLYLSMTSMIATGNFKEHK